MIEMTCPPNHTGTTMKLVNGGSIELRTPITSCVSSFTTSRIVSLPWRRASLAGALTRRRTVLPLRTATRSMLRPNGMKRAMRSPRSELETPRSLKPSASER